MISQTPDITEEFEEQDQRLPEDIQEIKQLLSVVSDKDTEGIALLQGLLKVRYIQERSNFPTQIEVQKQAYLLMAYRTFGPILGKPFLRMAYWSAVSWRGYKGFNYNGAIDAVKKGTDLSGIIMPGQPATPQPTEKKSFWSRHKNSEEVLQG